MEELLKRRKNIRQRITLMANKCVHLTKVLESDMKNIQETLTLYEKYQDDVFSFIKEESDDSTDLLLEEEAYAIKAKQLRDRLCEEHTKGRDPLPEEIKDCLKMSKFSGKFSDFDFWFQHFMIMIDNKKDLSAREKSIVLKANLDQDSRLMIERIPDTSQGYEKSKKTLEDFFKNGREMRKEYMRAVERMEFDVKNCRQFHREVLMASTLAEKYEETRPDQTERRQFRRLVMQKLPLHMRVEFVKIDNNEGTVTGMMEFLQNQVDKLKTLNEWNRIQRGSIPKTFTKVKERLCNYCHKSGHLYAKCEERLNVICNLCKEKGHVARQCKSNKKTEKYVPTACTVSMEKDPRVFTKMKVGETTIETLVDPGSIATFVPDSVVPESQLGNVAEFTMADGTPMETRGPIEVAIQVKEKADDWPVYAHSNEMAILGADFLKEHRAVIDMGDGTLTLKGLANDGPNNVAVIHPVELVEKYADVFDGIGLCKLTQHVIDTGCNRPVCAGSRRVPIAYMPELDRHVNELLEMDIIEVANSEWCSPINPVKKKDGTIRLAVDYRQLNQRTCWDAWPMPRVDEILDRLSDARWFSRIDLTSGYYQIPLQEESKQKTAFKHRNKLYQFKRMPMGLVTAPHTFQKLMTKIFGDLEFVECYLDDVVIFSKTGAEHLRHVDEVLKRVRDNGLRLNRKKCEFGVNEIEILGSKIKDGKRAADAEKLRIMKSFPTPENTKQVRAFLGFANYLRSFLPNFAMITRPLVECSSAKEFNWSEDCQLSFEKVKHLVAANPMTYLPDLNRSFIVTTDASNEGMGAVLSQMIDGQRRVIEFASKHFSPTQQRYATIEKEATAILFALKKWRHFLLGQEIVVETDHQPLKWLLTKQDCPDKLGRMAAQLQEYRIKGIEYIPGDTNDMADTLSRLQVAVISQQPKHVDTRIRKLADKFPEKYKREGERIIMLDGKYRRICVETAEERKYILQSLHDKAGHLRFDKTAECIRKRFYWPNWQRHLKAYLNECESCAKKKDDIEPIHEELHPLESCEPMERVHLDICGQLTASRGNRYFAVMVDAFTKWTAAKAFDRVTASNLIGWLRQVFDRHGTPQQITTDHGTQFDSREFRAFCQEIGADLHLTTVGHHQSNGLVEREIQTLEKMIRASIDNQEDWSRVLDRCVLSYNQRKHSSTGYSPFVLMFGREPELDIDREYGISLPPWDVEHVRESAKANARRQRIRAKQYYDRYTKQSGVRIGDKVLWHNEEMGRHKARKLNRRWRGAYVVVEIKKPVAWVEDAKGKRRKIHLNQLKRCEDFRLETFRGRGRPRNVREE